MAVFFQSRLFAGSKSTKIFLLQVELFILLTDYFVERKEFIFAIPQ